MRPPIRIALGVALAGAMAAAAAGQQVFRTDVEFVNIDVSVLDRQGRPVPDLKATEFAVELDGRRQPVRAMEYVDFTRAAPGEARRPATSVVSTSGRSILIVIDDLSFSRLDMRPLTDAAAAWIGRLNDGDRVGVMTTSGFAPTVDFSENHGAAIAALRGRLTGQKPLALQTGRISVGAAFNKLPEAGALVSACDGPTGRLPVRMCASTLGISASVVEEVYDCNDKTAPSGGLDEEAVSACLNLIKADIGQIAFSAEIMLMSQVNAYAHILRRLEAAPSPRALLLLSDGVPLTGGTGIASALRRAAVESGAQIVALSMQPETSAAIRAEDRSLGAHELRRENADFIHDGLDQLVDHIGGQSFRVPIDPTLFLDRALTRISGFYRLGVEVPALSRGKPVLAVKVTSARGGVNVRAPGRIARSNAPEPLEGRTMVDRLRDLVASGVSATALPVDLASTIARDAAGGQVRVTTSVRLPESATGPFSAVVAMVNEVDGTVRRGVPSIPPTVGRDTRAWFSFAVPAGRYRIRLAVADADGRIGTVEQLVLARLQPVGEFYAGDVALYWAGATGAFQPLGFRDLPPSATRIGVSWEIYGSGTPPAAVSRVTMELRREGEDDARLARDVTPSLSGTTALAEAEFPIARLEPGTYVVRVTAMQGEKPLGSMSGVFSRLDDTNR